MSSKKAISLIVNGDTRDALVSGDDTLLTVLRDQLHLTGTKRGCNQGICGACTVIIDGVAVRSCLSIAGVYDTSEILTVEGLSTNNKLSPIQLAFSETGAVQCGFCTAGMMIAAKAFLANNSSPTVNEIRHGISGNLCRCSGYKKIVDAIALAAKMIPRQGSE
jgi:carbon-monoxide dehydrogenase small subunit